jgi:hypothetical protein
LTRPDPMGAETPVIFAFRIDSGGSELVRLMSELGRSARARDENA